jgi:KDO2-lipid IV(A) lauroyltransferase
VRLQRIGHFAGYLVLRLFICFIQALRMETCWSLARGLATLFHRVLGVRRKVIEENLRHAFPNFSAEQREKIAWRMWEHFFLLIAEVALAPRKIHETNWREFAHFKNADVMTRLLLDERPKVLVTAHFGNFEMAGFMLAMLGFPTYSVARTLDNPYVDDFVQRFRGATGQHMVPKKGGYDQILNVLANHGHMGFLADQYAGSKGCWVNFFGRAASTHKAIALLALEHQAPLLVGIGRRLGKPLHYELGMWAVIDPMTHPPEAAGVRELTQWYTSQFEAMIRQTPEQYWWLHRRWKDNRPAKRRAKAA